MLQTYTYDIKTVRDSVGTSGSWPKGSENGIATSTTGTGGAFSEQGSGIHSFEVRKQATGKPAGLHAASSGYDLCCGGDPVQIAWCY